MGFVFLASLASMIVKEKYKPLEDKFDFNDIWGNRESGRITAALCFISGLLSGVAGIGGPPFIILALFYNVSRETFIGTYLFSRLLVSFSVLIILAITEDKYTGDLIPSIGATTVGGFCGVTLGQELSKHVKH